MLWLWTERKEIVKMVKVNRFLWIRAKFFIRLQIYKKKLSGPRLLSDGMEQLAWAGGWHVTRFLYSRDTNLHLPVVLAMLVSAGELCLFSRQLCLFSRQLCLFSQQLCLFSRKACRRQRLWFGDLASIIASSMLTIVLIDNERGGRGEGREVPISWLFIKINIGYRIYEEVEDRGCIYGSKVYMSGLWENVWYSSRVMVPH